MIKRPFPLVALVVMVFLIYLLVACWGCTMVKEGLERRRLSRDDSYSVDFYDREDEYFREYPYRIHVSTCFFFVVFVLLLVTITKNKSLVGLCKGHFLHKFLLWECPHRVQISLLLPLLSSSALSHILSPKFSLDSPLFSFLHFLFSCSCLFSVIKFSIYITYLFLSILFPVFRHLVLTFCLI